MLAQLQHNLATAWLEIWREDEPWSLLRDQVQNRAENQSCDQGRKSSATFRNRKHSSASVYVPWRASDEFGDGGFLACKGDSWWTGPPLQHKRKYFLSSTNRKWAGLPEIILYRGHNGGPSTSEAISDVLFLWLCSHNNMLSEVATVWKHFRSASALDQSFLWTWPGVTGQTHIKRSTPGTMGTPGSQWNELPLRLLPSDGDLSPDGQRAPHTTGWPLPWPRQQLRDEVLWTLRSSESCFYLKMTTSVLWKI